MVGHYPTIKLIGREHIPYPKSFHTPTCASMSYPVLITVSGGYPKVEGRLLTCYSPVRRSSTHKWAFPLDLHVLSTPPAFVLSQDQTLHRKLEKETLTNSQTQTDPESSKNRHPKKMTRQTKIIRRLSNTLLSSQKSDAPGSQPFRRPDRGKVWNLSEMLSGLPNRRLAVDAVVRSRGREPPRLAVLLPVAPGDRRKH
jgi:hypothetical protein